MRRIRRFVTYEIESCHDCIFYEDSSEDTTCDSYCHNIHEDFAYPEENDWFPNFCPLEKVVD